LARLGQHPVEGLLDGDRREQAGDVGLHGVVGIHAEQDKRRTALPVCIGPLAWIMLVLVVDEDDADVEAPQDAPMTLAAAETSPDTGREPRPQRTPLAELRPLSE